MIIMREGSIEEMRAAIKKINTWDTTRARYEMELVGRVFSNAHQVQDELRDLARSLDRIDEANKAQAYFDQFNESGKEYIVGCFDDGMYIAWDGIIWRISDIGIVYNEHKEMMVDTIGKDLEETVYNIVRYHSTRY